MTRSLSLLAGFLLPGMALASAGEVWTSTGPSGAIVQAMAADSVSAGAVYAGTRNGGVFRGEASGATPTWRAANAGLSNLNVRSIAVSPGGSEVVLAGTDAGVFRSANGAESWAAAAGPPAEPIDAIAFDRTAPATAYAASFTGWIGKSTDGGASWQSLGGPASGQRPQAVTVDPTRGATVYVGTLDGGLFKSEDGGATWVARNEGLLNLHVSAIAVDPTAPSNVYLGTDNGGVYRSTDGGSTWAAFNTGFQGTGVDALLADSTGGVYLANGVGVFGLLEGALGWDLLERIDDVLALALGPGTPGILWAGYGQLPFTSGGVAYSADHSTFVASLNGLNGVTVAALAVDPADPMRILTAGTALGFLSPDRGRTWLPGFSPALGLSLAFDPQSPGVVYEGVASGVLKSTDGGDGWANANAGLPTNPLVRALLVLPGAAGRLLAGTAAGVYRTTDAGATWSPPGTSVPAVVNALARDPSSTTVWAGAEDGVYRSTDEGVNWALSGNATGSPVYAVLVSAVAPKIFAGTAAGLLVSTDGGSSWTPVGGGLPPSQVFALVEDPDRTAIYAGGAAGVYESLDGGISWAPAAEGLTNPQVLTLALLPDGTLLAGARAGSVFQRVETTAERGPVERSEGRGETREIPPRP